MKTISRLLMLAALATAFALPAFAQDTAASPANVCDEQAKNDLYTQYYNLKKTNQAADQAKAFELTKQYIDKYGSCTDQYTVALKNFHDKYAAAVTGASLRGDFFAAYNAKDIAKMNSLGQQLLAKDPNDAEVALLMALGTYQGTVDKNPAATTEAALGYANKALAMIQAGQEPKDLGGKISWAPLTNKDEAVNNLNFAVASLELTKDTADASKRLLELAQGNSKFKEVSAVYSYLGYAYEQEAAPMLAKYKEITKNYTVETDESKLLLLNINQVIDRTIDAYARAAAYSTKPADKAQIMAKLTELYKSRHENKTDGLDAYVAGIKAQPLLITQPITTLPVAAPAATPGAGDGSTSTTTPAASPVAAPAAGTTAKPATTTTTKTTTTTTTTAKPATTTTTKPATTTTSKKPPVSRHH